MGSKDKLYLEIKRREEERRKRGREEEGREGVCLKA